jgi:hypothetical protein
MSDLYVVCVLVTEKRTFFLLQPSRPAAFRLVSEVKHAFSYTSAQIGQACHL